MVLEAFEIFRLLEHGVFDSTVCKVVDKCDNLSRTADWKNFKWTKTIWVHQLQGLTGTVWTDRNLKTVAFAYNEIIAGTFGARTRDIEAFVTQPADI